MKNVFALFLLLLFSAIPTEIYSQKTAADEVVKINTTLVSVPVIVSDRQGRYVSGLKTEDFTVYQDGVKQDIGFFATEEEPLNVALLLDTSRSTQEVLGKIKDAAKDFVKLLQPSDKCLVASFDYQVNILTPFTSDRSQLEKAIKKVDIGEEAGTVMRDAVREITEQSFAGIKGRKAIILLTDGKDFGSSPTKSELLNMLEESDVMVYSVFYKTSGMGNRRRMANVGMGGIGRAGGMGRMGGRRNGGIFGGRGGSRGSNGGGFPERFPNEDKIRDRQKRTDEEAIEYLEKMSDTTAGRFYQKDVTDLKATFELIADELRKQYRLGYYPQDDENKEAVHQIKVKVNRPDVAVRSRGTYRSK